MKSVILLASLFVAATPAFADGFSCQNQTEALNVKVYQNTEAGQGTRNAAVMVISDESVQYGNKTIARFTAENGTLTNQASSYYANVDHRFNDSGRKGELIGGTNLGALKTITLKVDFSYLAPMANGSHVEGILLLDLRNGEQITIAMDCARYLKN